MNELKQKFDRLHWFIIFISLIIVGNTILNKQVVYLIGLIPITFLIVLKRIKIKHVITIILVIAIFSILLLDIFTRNSIYLLNRYINNNCSNFYYVRSLATQQITNKNPGLYVGSYINMILFGEKNKYAYEIYNLTKDLSISHLFVVSGLHINILSLLISKLLMWKIKNKRIVLVIDLLISLVFLYFLRFAISIIRIFLNSIIKLVSNKLDNMSVNCLSGIIFLFIFKNDVINYGFMMSYFCTLGILFLLEISTNKVFLSISINALCILITVPFVANMNKRINIYAFFYNYIYSGMIIVQYIWFLCFGWFGFSTFINSLMVIETLKLININWNLSVFIDLRWWNPLLSTLYLSSYCFFALKK